MADYGMGCVSEKEFISCQTFELMDADGDGITEDEDCDDNDPNNFPGNEEICDRSDNNCDGQIDEGFMTQTYYTDNDSDGFGLADTDFMACFQPANSSTQAGDCDDDNPNINPDAIEIPGNGIDENCDGADEPSGTHELGGKSLDLFPNPVAKFLYVETDLVDLTYEVYDLKGKLLQKNDLKASQVNLDPFVSGIYLIKIYTASLEDYIIERIVKL